MIHILASYNPMDNIKPDISFLGSDFNGYWVKVGGVLWAFCIAGGVLYLAKGFLQYATARQQGMIEKVTEAAREIKQALGALAGLVALPILVTALTQLFGL
jgi:hypothetical protein